MTILSWGLNLTCGAEFGTFTLKKLECFKQAHTLNTLAWNCFAVLVSRALVMIDRDSHIAVYHIKYHIFYYLDYLIQYLLFSINLPLPIPSLKIDFWGDIYAHKSGV